MEQRSFLRRTPRFISLLSTPDFRSIVLEKDLDLDHFLVQRCAALLLLRGFIIVLPCVRRLLARIA